MKGRDRARIIRHVRYVGELTIFANSTKEVGLHTVSGQKMLAKLNSWPREQTYVD